MLPLVKYITLEANDLEFIEKYFHSALYFNKLKSKDFENTFFEFDKIICNSIEFLNYNGGNFIRFIEKKDKITSNNFKFNKTGLIGLKIRTNNLKFEHLAKKQSQFSMPTQIFHKPLKKKHFHTVLKPDLSVLM